MVKRARDVREEVLVEEDESVKEGGDARSVVESGGWELQCFLCRAQFSSRTELREHAESSHIGAAADQQKKRQNIVAARMDRSPDSADEGLALLRHEREEGCIGTGAECASQDAARRRLSWMLASMEKRRQLPASVSPAVSPDLGESRPVSCTQCTEQFMTLRELKRHAIFHHSAAFWQHEEQN
uniref:C2H2-type domain-containing protein n=1 Tax=Erythrolobus madagascarensis TaxID=708628 RepID=A0A7S0XNQ6_9RHOD